MFVNIIFDKMLFATTIFLYLCNTKGKQSDVWTFAHYFGTRARGYHIFIYHKKLAV